MKTFNIPCLNADQSLYVFFLRCVQYLFYLLGKWQLEFTSSCWLL